MRTGRNIVAGDRVSLPSRACRRQVVEPVIEHLKAEQRMDRNHLAHRSGDAANTLPAAIGYNFRLLLA